MSYVPNRVYVAEYGSLPKDSPLLVPVPTVPGKKRPERVHRVVAGRFDRLSAACERETGIRLLVASGHREKKWPTREAYEKAMIEQYGSVAEGQKWRAFESAHQTGLALDLGCGGISPNRKTIEKQRKTKLFLWLRENMWRAGFSPYLLEPWHIECRIPMVDYLSGNDSWQSCVGDYCATDHSACEES